jgi:hypothetical protein
MATGVTNVAFGREAIAPVVLRAGDVAPQFTLAASDGVTYRLSDFRGRPDKKVAARLARHFPTTMI